MARATHCLFKPQHVLLGDLLITSGYARLLEASMLRAAVYQKMSAIFLGLREGGGTLTPNSYKPSQGL